MDTPWYQAPNAVKLRASYEEGAQDASKSQTAATEAERKRYELEGEKHIQELAAKSIGPDGKFDPKAFKQAVGASKFAMSGLKAYAESVRPLALAEDVSQRSGAMLTEEGGVDPTKMVKQAKGSEFGGDVFRAGLGLQEGIGKTAQEVAGAKQNVSLLTEPGPAAPMSAQGIAESKPRPLGAVGVPKITADDVAKWAPDVAEARRDWLEAKGMPAKADAATIAKWYNEGMEAKVRAATMGAYDPQKPGSIVAATARGGEAAQEYAREATGQGREIKSTVQAQTGKAMDLKSQKMTMGTLDQFHVHGFTGLTQDQLGNAQKLVGDVNVIRGAGRQAEELGKDKKKLAAMSDDNFSQEVFNALNNIKVAENVSNLAGDEHVSNLFREQKSLGRIAAASSGPIDAFRNVIRNEVASTSREQVLADIQMLAKSAAANGVARSRLRAYGENGRLPGEWATAPMAPKSKAKPKAPTGPINLDDF